MSHLDDARGMRQWAHGSYADEAGVVLLIRSGLAQRHDLASAWRNNGLDLDALQAAAGPLSGGQGRILAIALSLLSGAGNAADVAVDLTEVLAGLDRGALDLVLAAIAHGAGSYEHGDTVVSDRGWPVSLGCLPPLHPWPEVDQQTTDRTARSAR